MKGASLDYPAPRPPALSEAGFDRYGPAIPDCPVIISVPHAGRDYPPDLLSQTRVRPQILRRLEDRWADLLAYPLIAQGFTVLVARTPRAMIDLNRHEREIDPAMVVGLPHSMSLQSSTKLRGGLGLIPRRLPGMHELWHRPLAWSEVQRRIEQTHQPYHAALAQMMMAARDAYGHAIVIDLHSMPPLPPPAAGQAASSIVLGDRFGRSASNRLVTLAADIATGHGLLTTQNHPYAGDHLIKRHGRPDRGMHAIQVEIDRALYLDVALDRPGPGLERIRSFIAAMVGALAVENPGTGYAMAAE